MNPAGDTAAAIRTFTSRPRLLPLEGAVQHYDWGGREFIPGLLGRANPGGLPFAELWIGAHPGAPATVVIDGATVGLDALVASAPEAVLGEGDARRFGGRLPYLLKVLDARTMLSLQAHPSLAQARAGFARENEAGIPLDAPTRSYRDDNHKPEAHAALTEFWMLHGFRPLDEIAETLETVPELTRLAPGFRTLLHRAGTDPGAGRGLLRELYRALMFMPQSEVDRMLDPIVGRLERTSPSDRDRRDFWALRAARTFPLPDGHRDRGIAAIYLLNLVHLHPGEGTFQPAGTLHAYLEGVTMELMANSDNVLRGGLTAKHVDAQGLLDTLTFEAGQPPPLDGRQVSDTETVYEAPVGEFLLSRIETARGKPHAEARDHGADCLIVLAGAARAVTMDDALELHRGAACLAPAGIAYRLEAVDGTAVIWRARVPHAADRGEP
ncbi:MAG: mannose-6-phosphate isomerase, class I [Spirochaetes bacterium]|nr:mannose-6-phosphate isomerase, class I [Spirochaetota bacterium]